MPRKRKRVARKELMAPLKPAPKPYDPTYGIPSPSNNRWGGTSVSNPRPYRGAKFRPASDVKILTAEEKEKFLKKMPNYR